MAVIRHLKVAGPAKLPARSRASELVDLRWEQIDLENAILHVGRVKEGTPATHPLTGRELRALRRLQREQESKSPFVFVSEHGTPFSTRGFQAMVERAAEAAGFDMKIHPHMLRHSCGFKLANDGVDTRTKPVWRTGVLQMAFPPHLTRKRNQIGRQGNHCWRA
jgi:integrase